MDCRRPSLLSVAAIVGAITLGASIAAAASRDTEALELDKKAIYTDYLATKFPDAEKKLKQALALCGASDCSDKVRARLHRDLGVVYVGGMSRVDDGRAEFVEALKADPSITLDADLASEDIDAAFKAAKVAAKGGAPPPAPSGSSAGPPVVPPSPPAPSAAQGDLVHTPPLEQAVLTPVPLYAELPRGVSATRVQLSYKAFGMDTWKTVVMKPLGVGFSFEVPCADIGSATGNLSYFIQAFDESNAMVSWTGSRAAPQQVPIRNELKGEPPHLPGQLPPTQCKDKGDCPPEFPGCHDQKPKENPPCDKEAGGCPADPPKDDVRKNWISVAFQQDFLSLSSDKATCAAKAEYSVTDYTCFNDAGADYGGPIYAMSGDEVRGGLGVGTSRIMAGYDRVLGNFTLGARVGFAFGGGPQATGGKAFFPVHAEARAAYYFGHDPFATKGLRPYVVLGGGVAQVDSKLTVAIYQNQADYVADKRTTLAAWRKSGIGFATAGVGAMFALTPRTGPLVELKLMQLFGTSGTAMNFQLGWALGF